MRFVRPLVAVAIFAGGWTAAYFIFRREVKIVAPGVATPTTGSAPKKEASRPATLRDERTFSVTHRLTELLPTAEIDLPHLQDGLAKLRTVWRRMPLVHSKIEGPSKALGTSIVIRTSDEEKAWVVTKTRSGKPWAPDAKIWNMSEGSFDQRESLFVPSTGRVGFKLTVPNEGRLDYAAGVALPTKNDVHFSVSVRSSGTTDKICETVVAAADTSRTWKDARCDLSKYAGKEVTLELATTSEELALGLFAHPAVSGRGSALPYNVLFIVVDALRPDALASFHDPETDRKMKDAKHPPLDAWLPTLPGLTPAIDELAKNSVRFTRAYSGGAWTRPGTLSMLAGQRSSELGVDTLAWVLGDKAAAHFYDGAPALLPLLFRKEGAATRAFVNNFFMGGYAGVGLDMGFERLYDERYRVQDTERITNDATAWMKAHADERFFLFCNYNSPHEPWEPPKRFLDRIPPPPVGPSDDTVRKYMAEAAKDDDAVGTLLHTLDELSLRERTLIVVTADHGETLSLAHDGRSKLDNMEIRFHHAVTDYEETTHIPILLSLPSVLPKGTEVKSLVRNVDLAPTLLEIEGLAPNAKHSGKSLLPLVRGGNEDQRLVISEGRGMRAVFDGRYRLLVREGAAQVITHGEEEETRTEELFDLEEDPGERFNIAKARPEVVRSLRAHLGPEAAAAITAAKTADPTAGGAPGETLLQIRIAPGGKAHRLSGKITAATGAFSVTPIGIPREAYRTEPALLEVGMSLGEDDAVGFDLTVSPPDANLRWEWFLDDVALSKKNFFAGPYGLAAPEIEDGIDSASKRNLVRAFRLPTFMPNRELGLFVVFKGSDTENPEETDTRGGEEMQRMLKDWGYSKDTGKKR